MTARRTIRVTVNTVKQSREWVDGSWVMGQMGHENRMGHMGHGSLVLTHDPSVFLTLWLDLYIVAMIIYRLSLWCMRSCACDWRSSKFTFTLPRVPGYPSGTRVINFPGNFLLLDGYPGSEYLICRIIVYCCMNKCIINERYIPEHQNKLNIYDLQNYEFFAIFFLNRKKIAKFVIFQKMKKNRRIRILDLWLPPRHLLLH